MKSSTGKHYVALEHVRALAAFLVFTWHFLHINGGQIKPLTGTFWFPPNSLFAEGHTGVAIFMVLSGYLFSKITDGKRILYFPFIYNRILRLAPLLIAVLILFPIVAHYFRSQEQLSKYLAKVFVGPVLPTWPNGGWSITIEFHFYLLFPLLLMMENKRKFSSLIFILLALALRIWIYRQYGTQTLQYLSYHTIIGRIDQFILGMLFYRYGAGLKGRHFAAAAIAVTWIMIWYAYDLGGGFRGFENQQTWIFMTILEGLTYGALISWYDRSFTFSNTGVSGVISKIGECSYSIYLLHFFVVFDMAIFVDRMVVPLNNFYVAFVFSAISFLFVAGVGYISYRGFETIFLKKRIPYLVPVAPPAEKSSLTDELRLVPPLTTEQQQT
ncbi:MAG: acyltransferase family protein [Planctomycetaceae bacterium]